WNWVRCWTVRLAVEPETSEARARTVASGRRGGGAVAWAERAYDETTRPEAARQETSRTAIRAAPRRRLPAHHRSTIAHLQANGQLDYNRHGRPHRPPARRPAPARSLRSRARPRGARGDGAGGRPCGHPGPLAARDGLRPGDRGAAARRAQAGRLPPTPRPRALAPGQPRDRRAQRRDPRRLGRLPELPRGLPPGRAAPRDHRALPGSRRELAEPQGRG